MKKAFALVLILLVAIFAASAAFFWFMARGDLWLFKIAEYERADRIHPPQPGVIVFTGSSSIRLWTTLQEDMKPLDVINRGFGGSTIAQVNRFAARVVLPRKPRAVVLYAGDNDLYIWRKSPEAVLEDFKRFVNIVHTQLPDTWIYYISIKPAPKGNWATFSKANGMIESYIRSETRVQFINVSSAMLDSQGHLRPGFYGADPMHMNASGYVLWTSIIKPILISRFGDAPAAPNP